MAGHADKDVEKGDQTTTPSGIQTNTVTREITISLESVFLTTVRIPLPKTQLHCSWESIQKCSTVPQEHLLNYVPSIFIHTSQKLETS